MIDGIISFDTLILHVLFQVRTMLGGDIVALLTELGGGPIVIIVTAFAMFALYRRGHLNHIAGLAISLGGSMAAVTALKLVIDRARPPESFRAVVETGPSFPSRHAVAAMALYGFLAYLVFRFVSPEQYRRVWIMLLAILILIVGFSRLYLGVHYFSDVVAGYLVGALFVWIGIIVSEKLR